MNFQYIEEIMSKILTVMIAALFSTSVFAAKHMAAEAPKGMAGMEAKKEAPAGMAGMEAKKEEKKAEKKEEAKGMSGMAGMAGMEAKKEAPKK